ncbi:uncharacterized protein LOC133305582 [Gastrolobium bilobum]|uniref:uncharacterized protein LOC133305582 n=1 Tax=Gastrolobium bilobum TaxID=150636 RepID=UPI002AB19B6B|nr:uncharacterized protein LOC133305582 [Gastrolobium bilobum]
MIRETTEQIKMIRDRLRKAQDRQKSYYDLRHRPLEFEVEDHVFIKLSPVTGVGRSLGVRKLSPRYIGPYQILKRVGPVAYQLALPPNLANLHDVFHESQLKKYLADPSHVVLPDIVEVRPNLKIPVVPYKILDKEEKRLRSKVIPMVGIPVVSSVRVLVTFTKFEELQQVDEFESAPSSPTGAGQEYPEVAQSSSSSSSSSWFQWIKAPYAQSSSSTTEDQVKCQVDHM